jgi:hypothetical protein
MALEEIGFQGMLCIAEQLLDPQLHAATDFIIEGQNKVENMKCTHYHTDQFLFFSIFILISDSHFDIYTDVGLKLSCSHKESLGLKETFGTITFLVHGYHLATCVRSQHRLLGFHYQLCLHNTTILQMNGVLVQSIGDKYRRAISGLQVCMTHFKWQHSIYVAGATLDHDLTQQSALDDRVVMPDVVKR